MISIPAVVSQINCYINMRRISHLL